MNLSVKRIRLRAYIDASIAVLASVAIGSTLIRFHDETITVNLAALGVGVTLVTVAALSVVLRKPVFSTSADRVTLIRVVLAGACATIVALSIFGTAPTRTWLLIALAAPALLLDAVDGWLARKTRTANPYGARLDMETDAAFLLVLSIPVAVVVGLWALLIGAMRYLFVAISWWRPALRQELSFSRFRRITAGIQGAVLAVALAPIVPVKLATIITMLALALLVLSFGKDVVSLERAYKDSAAFWLWTAVAFVVAFMFVRAAIEKLISDPVALEPFQEFGWPLWFAYLTAVVEIVGAIALIIPQSRALGGLLLIAIMIGAAFTNIINGHPDYLWVNALLIVGSLVLVWQRLCGCKKSAPGHSTGLK